MTEYRYQIEDLSSPVTAIGGGRTERSALQHKLRILMVGMHLTKTRGGISTLTSGILDSGLQDEFDFKYIASQAEDFGRIRKLMLAISSILRFLVACSAWRPALVYVHMGSNASLYRESIFVLLGKLFGKKVIVHFHAGDIDKYYPFQPSIGRRFINYAIGISDRVIAVSNESAGELRELNADLKISVIVNAIDTSTFRNRQLSSTAVRSESIRLLFVGAIGKLKGENDLIAALAILCDELPQLKVSFLGFGAEHLEEKLLEKGVSHLVGHLGAVSMNERIAFYEQADIFVLPTYAEAMPMSVIEAMAAGLPVVSTRVGGIPELIDDHEEGLLFVPGDVASLVEHIRFLATNREARLMMGNKGRRRVSEQLSFSKYIYTLRDEIYSVCDPKKRI